MGNLANHTKGQVARRVAAHLRDDTSSDEWYTPIKLLEKLGPFDLDPACGPLCPNRTAANRFDREGLSREWFGRVWLNPPFSNAKPWIDRLAAHGDGIALVFARVDAKRPLFAGS